MTLSIMHRTVSGALLLTLLGCFYLSVNRIGFSSHESGDQLEVGAGSHPAVIVWAVVIIYLYVALLRKPMRTKSVGPANMMRRFLSFLIDLFVFSFAASSILALIPLEVEARRVGHFEWNFTRDYAVSTDSIILPLTLLLLVEFFLYAVYPLTKGKQTIGEYVMRIRVLPPFGNEGRFTWYAAIKRIFYASIAACFWPYTLATSTDRNGQTWYDRKTNSNVSLVDYKRNGADGAS